MIDKTVSHYKILEKLGEGGMGVVYKARNLKLDSLVALKFLPPHMIADEKAKQRFVQEAKAASSLQHSNICSVSDIDETPDGGMFIVMPYYEGETLHQKITRNCPDLDKALDITAQIASGLAKAHETGIIHRDVKPGNVLITNDGNAKLLDFGLAKLSARTRVTTTGKTVGTVAYMSPEQVRGEDVDARSDIFSLGVVLYELLTGELPFQADHPAAIMYSITNKEPRRLSEYSPALSRDLQRIVDTALRKDSSQRYPTMRGFLEDLERAKRQRASTAPVGEGRTPTRRVVLIALAALILVAAGFAAFKHFVPARHAEPVTAVPADEKFVVVVAPFWGANAEAREDGRVMQALVQRKIDDVLGNEKDVQILGTDVLETPRSHAEARDLGRRLGATMVLWGEVLVLRGEVEIQPYLTIAESAVKLRDRSTNPLQSTLAEPNQLSMRKAKAEEMGNTALLISAAYYRTSNPDRALALLARISPPSAESLRQAAQIHWNKRGPTTRDRQEAVRLLKRAVEVDPNDAGLYSDLGWYYLGMGEYAQAIAVGEKALTLDPNHFWAHRHIAIAHKLRGEYEQAIRVLEKAIPLGPDFPHAHQELADIYLLQGNYDDAAGEIAKAIAVNPRSAWSYGELGLIYTRMGKHDAAASEYMKAIELDSTYAWPHFHLAEDYAMQGKYDAAINEYSKAIELDPTNARFPYKLALLYFSQGDLTRSIAASQIAAAKDVQGPDSRLYGSLSILAEARDAQGEHAEAVATSERLIRLFPEIEFVHIRYFICLYRAGDVDKARSYIGEFVDSLETDTWGGKIASFYAGRITEKALLKASNSNVPLQDAEQKCEAYYYLGMAQLLGVGTRGKSAPPDTVRAAEYFRESVATGVIDYSEYWRSLGELNRLQGM